MRAAAKHGDGAPRGHGALWDKFPAPATEAGDHAIHHGVIGGTVDLSDRDPILDGGKHTDLPVGDVAGKDDHSAPGDDCPKHMLEAMRFDPPPGLEHTDFAEMRVFGRDPAEIIPHPDDNTFSLSSREARKGGSEIELRAFGNAEMGADA